MSSPDPRASRRLVLRAAAATGFAALVAGCFQPLYGQRSVIGGESVGQALRGVEVEEIRAASGTRLARLANEVRNNLIFGLTGGSGQGSPTHKLIIQLNAGRDQVIVDVATARPDIENYNLNASYTLVDLTSGETVVRGQTFARVSYDIPGQAQRFARDRGLRDAENRAAGVIADNIKNRLASHFVAGT